MTDAATSDLVKILAELLPGASIDIRNDTHKHLHHNAEVDHHGGHWHARIVWPGFDGMPRLARHRLVHDALKKLWHDRSIHSLSLRLMTPAEVR